MIRNWRSLKLEVAGNIKCGHLKMMSVEFDAVDNDLCTEYMSVDDHDDPDRSVSD